LKLLTEQRVKALAVTCSPKQGQSTSRKGEYQQARLAGATRLTISTVGHTSKMKQQIRWST
jgi:hypothetical protein